MCCHTPTCVLSAGPRPRAPGRHSVQLTHAELQGLKIGEADQCSHLRDGADPPKPRPAADPGSRVVPVPNPGAGGERVPFTKLLTPLSPPPPLEQQWPFSAGQAALGNEWGQPGAGGTMAGWAPVPSDPCGERQPGNRAAEGEIPQASRGQQPQQGCSVPTRSTKCPRPRTTKNKSRFPAAVLRAAFPKTLAGQAGDAEGPEAVAGEGGSQRAGMRSAN